MAPRNLLLVLFVGIFVGSQALEEKIQQETKNLLHDLQAKTEGAIEKVQRKVEEIQLALEESVLALRDTHSQKLFEHIRFAENQENAAASLEAKQEGLGIAADIDADVRAMMDDEERLINQVRQLSQKFQAEHIAQMEKADSLLDAAQRELDQSNQIYDRELLKAQESAARASEHSQYLNHEDLYNPPDLEDFPEL